ncbi:VOC family protein [Streptomyces sp. TRM 70351]|uniref:VOC family protein n=1 Tax=Streptomyces sp. TRM 70351 TaxID=3116552 RepID=UPI002E7BD106|nr:VOC family protein [Streptomyces sp. TRM 70351]MEE1926837.1 VOC family protein [Streptomyces sp. TRM 70351]
MAIKRAFASILSDRLPETRDFFSGLLGLSVVYDSDWFVSLQDPDDPRHELGIWRRDHELVPEPYRTAPSGTVLTFVVDDVDAVHRAAREQGREIVAPPRDTFYGQRSMLVKDPNGQLLDICTPVAG